MIGVGSHSVLLALLLWQGGALEAFGQEPRADGATAPKEAGEVRARDLGIPFHGTPGPLNAITDVPGVEVGQVTLISGEGKLRPGEGPVRTGVTAILPRGRASNAPVFAGWFTLNGFGELTGTTFVEETGLLLGPVMITGTHSMGVVRDATNEWYRRQFEDPVGLLPVVGETWPGTLSDRRLPCHESGRLRGPGRRCLRTGRGRERGRRDADGLPPGQGWDRELLEGRPRGIG